jgi:hypothetical protein
MTTQTQDLQQRITTVLKDINEAGRYDAEAMWVMGSIASQILSSAKITTWAGLRRTINDADFGKLIETFQTKGNEFVAEGNKNAAYAVQALSLSVVTRNQTDSVIVEGGYLLDTIIDRAVLFFRQNPPTKN